MSLGTNPYQAADYANFGASDDGTGSYIIQSDGLRALYPQNYGGGFINIRNYGTKTEPSFVAQFDFGFIEGILRFKRSSVASYSTSPEARLENPYGDNDTVQALRDELGEAKQRIEKLETELFNVKDQSLFTYDNISALMSAISRARNFEEMKIHLNNDIARLMKRDDKLIRKRKREAKASASDEPSPVATSHQHSGNVSVNPLRFDFQWRGRDTTRGILQVNPVQNHGFIEFSDESKTKFSGQISGAAVGDKLEFTGSVIEGMPASLEPAKTWESYSDPFANTAAS